MEKQIFTVKCESTQQAEKRGTVQFSIGGETVPNPEPGKPPVRTAKTIFTHVFTEPSKVANYIVGEEYKITIE